MNRLRLPISALPTWTRLNDVTLYDVAVRDLSAAPTTLASSGGIGDSENANAEAVETSSRGYGLVAQCNLSSRDVWDRPTLMEVPGELVLNAAAVDEYAKVEREFAAILEAVGDVPTRQKIILFLLMQITLAGPEGSRIGASNPWTEYVKMLADEVPLPTTWSEDDLVLLTGTSLEASVPAKLRALHREFSSLQESTSSIPWCQTHWWSIASSTDLPLLTFRTYLLLDAWYRSRSLELPLSGESMVPCLDMANHSTSPTAYFEQTADAVKLLLRPDQVVKSGAEITISYGQEKSPAEMLFSYGFIDQDTDVQKVTLHMTPMPDDPLGKAKMVAFGAAPTAELTIVSSGGANSSEAKVEEDEEQEQDPKDDEPISHSLQWHSPFTYLLALNEEDSLTFRLLQSLPSEAGQEPPSLRVFWADEDVTSRVAEMDAVIASHPLFDVFKLRAVALLEAKVGEQLEQLELSESAVEASSSPVRDSVVVLRERERAVLEVAARELESEREKLLESDVVLNYLAEMQGGDEEERAPEHHLVDEEDFS